MATELRITGAQVRMARAFLGWSIAELGRQADVGISTLQRIEATDGEPGISADGIETNREWRETERAKSLAKVAKALAAAGITFLSDDGKGGPGIRGRAKKPRG
jgi:hypothetical protein